MTTRTNQTAQAMRQQMGSIHAQLAQCAHQDDLIAAGAKERLKVVQDRILELGKDAVTTPEHAQEYLKLVRERAALMRVLEDS